MAKKSLHLRGYVALLRGINVGGHNQVSMARLKEVVGALGWLNVQSYIRSGNVVFQAPEAAADVESKLERAIEKEFGVTICVIVREAAAWPQHVKQNPFLKAAKEAPNSLYLCLSKSPPNKDSAGKLQERGIAGEQVKLIGDAVWIHFLSGMGKTKLSPALMDRLIGSPVTARNWRTVLKLKELAATVDAE